MARQAYKVENNERKQAETQGNELRSVPVCMCVVYEHVFERVCVLYLVDICVSVA